MLIEWRVSLIEVKVNKSKQGTKIVSNPELQVSQ
jgi:hypothetical protein